MNSSTLPQPALRETVIHRPLSSVARSGRPFNLLKHRAIRITIRAAGERFLRIILAGVIALGLFIPGAVSPVFAAAVLTITPITWNIVGLDSNNVNVGPNDFPIGARVCNTGNATATNLSATFNWDSANALINNRPGTLTTITASSLAAGSCTDFYFEVEVTRNALAYDTTRDYHITVTATGGLTASTPMPRKLYVEHLISQNRNSITDVQYGTSLGSLTSVGAGGTMTLVVGNTYYIKMVGATATQGYEQIESFINIPNTIFQVLSVDTTYSAESSPTLTPPYDKLYGNACMWENDPASPNYRACLDVGKAGGNITVTYQVKILQTPSAPLVNPEPLSTLIYDFSGSSYHYNSDYGTSTRYAYIVSPTLTKAFSPKTISPGGTSTLTFKITNPGADPISNAVFTDTLPANVSVAGTPGLLYTGCGGSPAPASLSSGATSLSFSNITVSGNSTCTITLNVTASVTGTYNNTTGHLFINNTIDTGSFGTDSLVVSSLSTPPSSCANQSTLATWTMPTSGQGSGGPPPPFTTKASDVSTATSTSSGGTTNAITTGGVTTDQWKITGGWQAVPDPAASSQTPYFEFTVDSSNYGGLTFDFAYDLEGPGNWASIGNNKYFIFSEADGGVFTTTTSSGFGASKGAWTTASVYTATTSGASTTTFRITVTGAKDTSASVGLDNIIISGCPRPTPPTLSKGFSPASIPLGSTSTLTFTVTNPNTSTVLSGISFSDTLPTGLSVATSSSSQCGGTLTTTNPSTISLSGGTLAASASCTISVTVTGNTAGQYQNISGSVSSTQSGANTTASGYGTSSLTVIAPPVIAKSFGANSILTGSSITLTLAINNPNIAATLTGVAFTDTLPSGLVVATPNGLSNGCGGTATATAGSSTVSLSGVSLAAGATCTITLQVTGNTTGLKTNSVTVTSTNGGTGNTATASVLVKDPTPLISVLKQISTSALGPWLTYVAVTTGSGVYYKITVENIGDAALSSVNVTDPLVSLASCSWQDGDGDPLTAPFTLSVASAGNNNHIATCTVGPITTTSGSHPNTALASGLFSSTTVTDTASATYATTGLTLAKNVAESSFIAGTVLHYTYVVTNTGFATIAGPVTIADDKSTDESCPAVSTVGDGDDWFDVGESLTCTATYTATGADAAATFITNLASATASGVTSNTASKTVYLTGTSPDLSLTKTDGVLTASPGNILVYTLTITNTGTAPAFNSLITDTLPANTTFIAASDSGTFSGGLVTWTAASLASGAFTTRSITVTVNSPLPAGVTAITNTATSTTNGDTTPGNNTATDVDTITAAPDLQITKTDSVGSTTPGATLVYVLTVTNVGNIGATGLLITDTVPANTTFVAASNGGLFASGLVTWNVASLAGGGASLTRSITVTVDNPLPLGTTAITNTATTTEDGSNGTDPNPGDNTTTDVDVVNPGTPDLAIAKTDGLGATVPGATLVYTLTITNNGPVTATGVVITDTIPANTAFVSASNSGVFAGGLVTWGLASLAGGGTSVTRLVTVTVDSPLPGGVTAITNTVTVGDDGSHGVDPAPSDNTTTDVDTVVIIDAVNDSGSTINGATGGTSLANVLTNDTLNGAAATLANVTLSFISSTDPGVTLDLTDGSVDVAPGTPAGSYTLTYQICDQANPTICDTATVTVPVVVIDAVNDTGSTVDGTTGGTSLANVLTNDTLNGGAATLANVTLSFISSTNAGVTLDLTDGSVDVAPGTAAGNYTLTYQICDQANPTICDTATVSVPVVTIDAVNDSGSTINGATGGTSLANVLTNDTLNGAAATLANVTLSFVSSTNAGVTLDLTDGSVDVAPGTAAGNYTLTYQICDQVNPTICDTATVTVPVVTIDAVNDSGSTINGATGGTSLANVLTNDTLNGAAATLANVTLSFISSTNAGVTLDLTDGSVDVAPGTAAGNYTLTYQICDQANPTICDTATVSVPVVVIDAVNDSGATVDGTTGGTSLANVLTNDTLNGSPATLANVTLSFVSSTNAGVTLDLTDGSVDVAPGTPAGNYTLTYQICDQANPTICDTATVSVPVVVIDAVNDSGATVDGTAGGTSLANVLTNDTLNGGAATLANVTLSFISSTNAGVTLDLTDGSVDVAPGTPAGNYTLTYQICDQANPTICDTATVSVPVVVIDAVNDSGATVDGTVGGTSLANVLTNDTLNGAAATLANVTLSFVSSTNAGVTLDLTDGSVDVAPGTAAGNYTLTYQICDQANPTICDTATVSVPVLSINAVNDTGTTVDGTTGGTSVTNVLTNDTVNGVAATLANVTLSFVSSTNAGVTLDLTDGSVDVAPGTPAGSYTLTYQICDQANPTSCDTATVTVPVVTIDAVNDSGATVDGTTGGTSLANVLTNDTLNGSPATLANVTLSFVSSTNAGVTLDLTDGSVDVAPGTPTGNYTLTYQICDQANPTICDTATVTVPVVTINAVNDSGATVDGTAGGTSLANVLTNDTLNGSPATLANVTLSFVSSTNAGVTLDLTDGSVDVAPGTPAGSYTLTYQICDQANPTICDTATVSVPVVVIDAVNDSGSTVNSATGGTSVANVLTNDTLNGSPATLANVTLSFVSSTNAGVTLDLTDGSVDVAPGTPAGSYTLTYQICDQANPTICDTATVTVPVGGVPDLQISKTDGVASTTPGATLVYTLSITNTGTITATGVLVTDTISVNTTFVSASNSGVFGSGRVTWPSFSLGIGVSTTRLVTVTVNNPLPAGVTTITNTATVTDDGSNGSDPTPINNTTSDVDPVAAAPDLRLSKSDGGVSPMPGGIITYTLNYTNTGTAAATGVVITETVPNNTRYNATSSLPTVWSCPTGSLAGTICTTNLPGSVAGGGGSGSVRFAVRVDNPLPGSVTSIVNTANIGDDGTNGPDPTPINNIGTVGTIPTAVKLLYFKVNGVSGLKITLGWATAMEVDHYGFNLYRAPTNDFSKAMLIHFEPATIPGGNRNGATYQYVDTVPTGGQWWYWLKDVDTHGRETFDASTNAKVGVGPGISLNYIYLPFVINGDE